LQAFVWRHNRTFHSHSMIQEPCVHQDFYLDAVAVVVAATMEEAVAKLVQQNKGWRAEDLYRLPPKVFSLQEAAVLFSDIRG